MNYEFSLAHLTVLGCPPPEVVRIAAACGYEYASLRPVFFGLPGEPNYELAKNPVMLRETKQALADTGIRIHDIELFRIAADKDVRNYEAALEVGAELGAKSALSSIWTDDIGRATEQFGILAELAAKYNLNVDLEFVTWAAVYDLQSAAAMLKEVKAPNAGILVDTLHFNRSRIDVAELDSLPAEWIHFIHLCDGPAEIPAKDDTAALIHTGRDARLYVGEGGIDIADILNRLPQGVCSIELPHLERVKEYGYEEHARRCLISAKEYINKHQVTGKQ